MNFLGFSGSPRTDGTTNFIIEKLLEGAKSAGANTSLYNINEMVFQGCQGCRKCKTEGACDLVDDMTPVYPKIMESDVLVLGSPIYMAYVTGQTKLFLDRLYAFTGPDQVSRLPAGKKCILVLTQGYSDTSAYQGLVKSLSSLVTRLGFEVIETLVVGGVYKREDEQSLLAGEQAYKLGAALNS